MGLLDALFDPSTYSGQQGGLLDLIKQAQAQQAVQPNGEGFPPTSPTAQPFNPSRMIGAFDPSTFAPNQAQPIQIGQSGAPGAYQMPRIGGADQFTPVPGSQSGPAMNANAQAAPQQQAAPQPQAQEPQQQLPPALGGNNSANPFVRGLQSVAGGGGIISAIRGDYNDPKSLAQQNLKAQYDAVRQTLRDSGEDERTANSKAMLAVMNPEAGKTILTEALTNKQKYGVINEDPLSGKQYGFINERDQTVNGKPLSASGSPAGQSSGLQGMTEKITAMRTQGATKEQMLEQIPAGYRDDVASLISGKSVPANMGRAQSRMALLTLAKVVDPSFDEQMIPTRIAMRKDFSGEGKNGQAIGAFNTVQHHIGQVSDALEEFEKAGGGSNWPILNAIKLGLANNSSYDPKLRDAAQKLNDKLNAAEHEVANAYNSGHVTDADRKTWNEIKASNLPADQLKQKLADFDELLSGKRESLNHIYQTTFHEDAPTIDKKANEETSAKVHSRLPGAAPSGGPAIGTVQKGYKFMGGDPSQPSSWQKQ
jgi:hypothetical protein